MACLALAEWGLAEQAFVKGLDLGPENREMVRVQTLTAAVQCNATARDPPSNNLGFCRLQS